MLSNAYFLAKFRFDTAENEPANNLQNFRKMHFRKFDLSDVSTASSATLPKPEVLHVDARGRRAGSGHPGGGGGRRALRRGGDGVPPPGLQGRRRRGGHARSVERFDIEPFSAFSAK